MSIARERAKQLGVPVTVFTFNPHPTIELRPQAPLKLLMTYEEKRLQLSKYGVDFCIEEPFNHDFAKTSAHDFFFEILKNRLHAKAIVVGEDFAFGNMREGKIEILQRYCDETGTVLDQAKPVFLATSEKDYAPVSSSRIRDLLAKGEVSPAEKLLGHPFFYRGEVIHGDHRGRTIGFPTANMKCEEKFPLLPGVYATSVFWQDRRYPSVTNIGKRPTFQGDLNLNLIPLRIETHLLHQNLDLYGEILEVRFHEYLRAEQKFNSIDELKNQIQADANLAESILLKRFAH